MTQGLLFSPKGHKMQEGRMMCVFSTVEPPTPGTLKGREGKTSWERARHTHTHKKVQKDIIAPEQMQPRCHGDVTLYLSSSELSAQERATLTATLSSSVPALGEGPAALESRGRSFPAVRPTRCPLGGMLRDIRPFPSPCTPGM